MSRESVIKCTSLGINGGLGGLQENVVRDGGVRCYLTAADTRRQILQRPMLKTDGRTVAYTRYSIYVQNFMKIGLVLSRSHNKRKERTNELTNKHARSQYILA